MKKSKAQEIIEEANRKVAEMRPRSMGGKWLEIVTMESSPYTKGWDFGKCWYWDKWPNRGARLPNTTMLGVGIDSIAGRRSDGEYLAIQCKSRQLDKEGRSSSINKKEIAKSASGSDADFWAERWDVDNGDNLLAEAMLLNEDGQFNGLLQQCALIEERAKSPPTMGRYDRNN